MYEAILRIAVAYILLCMATIIRHVFIDIDAKQSSFQL